MVTTIPKEHASFDLGDPSAGSRAVRLTVAATRTKFFAMQLRMPDGTVIEAMNQGSLEPTFLFKKEYGPGDRITLLVEHLGEYPVLLRPVRWVLTQDVLDPSFGSSAVNVDALRHRRASFLERLRAIYREPNRKTRSQMLGFFRLDQRTDDQFLGERGEYAERAKLIESAAAAFAHRSFLRGCGTPNPSLQLEEPQVLKIERVFRSLLESDFPSPSSLSEAFDAFACGDLSAMRHSVLTSPLFLTHGVPNGTYFFSFAEAALEFLRRDPLDEYWSEAFRSFVRGSEIFVELYWGGGPRRRAVRADGETPPYAALHLGSRRFGEARLKELRQTYKSLPLKRLEHNYTAIVKFAFRDSRPFPLTLFGRMSPMSKFNVRIQTLIEAGDGTYDRPPLEPTAIKAVLDRIRAKTRPVQRTADRDVSNALLHKAFSDLYGLYRREEDEMTIDLADGHDSYWDEDIRKWVAIDPGMYYPTSLTENGMRYFVGIEYHECVDGGEAHP